MSVKWLMELVDKVSPPAKGVAKSLEHVDRQVEKLEKHSKQAQGSLDKFAHHIDAANKKAGKEFLEGLAEKFAVFNVGYELAEHLAEKLFELGEEFVELSVDAANFGRQSRIVFGALTGSAEKAEELTEYTEKFASRAGIGLEKTRQLVDTLTRGGFEDRNLNVVMNAAVDVEALTFGRHKAEELADAFLDISEKGQLSSRSLMQFRGMLGERGIDRLAAQLKLGTHGFKQLQQALEDTPVGAHRAQQAILNVLEEASGGKVGGTAEKLSHELPQVMTRFANNMDQLLSKVGQSPAWERVLAIGERFANAFDPASESGKHFEASLERVAVAVGDLFEPLSKQEDFNRFVDKMTKFADNAATAAQGVIAVAEAIGSLQAKWEKVPWWGKRILSAGLLGDVDTEERPLKENESRIGLFGVEYAEGYGPGGKLADRGSASMPDYVTDSRFRQAGADAYAGLEYGFREAGDTHSPSREMMKAGADAFEGLRLGVTRPAPSSSTGRAPLIINLEVVVQGGGDDAEEQGRLAGRAALGELQPLFDTLAEQLG